MSWVMEDRPRACSGSQASPGHRNLSSSKQSAIGRTAGSESAQPWTATRCHRLLRPLLTQIAALRKDKERRASTRFSTAASQSTKPRNTVLGKRGYPYDDADYSDKKPCRKYSRKASRRASAGDQSCTPQRHVHMQRRQTGNRAPDDVVLPTPLLRRIRNREPSSPAQAPGEPCQEEASPASRCSHSRSGCSTKCIFEMQLTGIRPIVDPEGHGLFESVFRALDYLLRSTAPRKNKAAHSKSLLAMCLRKVPGYIAGLEEWGREEANANGTKSAIQGAGVSFEIYSELESLGAVGGWKHLCLVVRAHAVHILQDAVSEKLFDNSVADLLIRVCLEYMPPMEFKGLLDAFVVRQYPKPRSTDYHELAHPFTHPDLRPIKVLTACDPSATSIMPRVLADLLADGLLPADWILHRGFISIWPSTVRKITQTKSCQDTVNFVITTLGLLCELATPRKPRGVPQTRLRGKSQTTLVSAVAALGSVVLLSEERSSEPSETCSASRAVVLRRRISYIVSTCSANLKHRKAGGRKLGIYLLALCSFLSLEDNCNSVISPASTLETSWRGVQHCRGNATLMLQYDATITLMSAMAYSCSRGAGLAPHVYLSRFCDKLQALDLPAGALSNMRVDGAFRLAEHTGDLRDLAFAEAMRKKQAHAAAGCVTPEQKARGSCSQKQKKKNKAASFSGIRWDDGISEWVAATPGTELRQVGRRPGLRSGEAECSGGETNGDWDISQMEPETEHSDTDSGSSPEEDDERDGSASETAIESETTDPLSPNTEASPIPSDPHPDSASEGRPHSDDDEDEDEDEDEDVHHSDQTDPIPAGAKQEKSPPTPAGGFLAARPRRLSRPVTGAGDELAFDADHDGHDNSSINNSSSNSNSNSNKPKGKGTEKANLWLCRKKPARFRTNSIVTAKKRVTRASLVYLQPVERPSSGNRGKKGGYARERGGESDDELRIL
ncbi:hypothetical protein N658DRAFT_491026 [Parathielavia hyrcaniae]|uniref:Uncharacterized protein n=1 Tax=Parathielavia hyrcaniae TaxID=113614 RepID=A0AAN6T6B5_9PEZI|nr:hypothetical protein N658DRAFT_491026 [Parathielavia hyrcaniae]